MTRTVFVGDVHGCLAELLDLFDLVALGTADAVCFVGDLVARGPDSRGVVQQARQLGARAAMGNHDARVVAAWRARERGERDAKAGRDHERVVSELAQVDLAWLAALPPWVDVDEHAVKVVHAGVVPGVPLEQQAPALLLNLRTIAPDGSPRTDSSGALWGTLYTGPPHVVFGHHARARLQVHEWATGLDTGCVYGGELSALVLRAGDGVPPPDSRRDAIVSVRARKEYFTPR